MQKKQVKLTSFIGQLRKDPEGTMKGGFASIKGGSVNYINTTNKDHCTNDRCDSTNQAYCINTGYCEGTTNTGCSNKAFCHS